VPGTLHWVSAQHALPVEARLYDRLFRVESPATGAEDLGAQLNPRSLVELHGWIEPSVAAPDPGSHYQFERLGFFFVDPHESRAGRRVFNRTVTLKDSWAKAAERARPAAVAAPVTATAAPAATATADPLAGLDADARTRAEGYRDAHGLPPGQARLLAEPAAVSALFEEALAAGAPVAVAAKWIVNELLGRLKDRASATLPFGGRELAELASLVEEGTISWTTGKEVLGVLFASGGSPRDLVRERGLEQLADAGVLVPLVERLLAENPDKVAAYRAGKTTLLGWFVGQAMRASGGRANPQVVQELVRARL
jgi:glutaminyl-tRNA synthetase